MIGEGTPIEVQREAIKGEVEQRVAQELVKHGLDKLTFSPETLRKDMEALLDYYGGPEVLPHAINVYSVEETLKEYAPNRDKMEVNSSEREQWQSQLFKRGQEYDQPFHVPIEFEGMGVPEGFFGDDYAKRYREGKPIGMMRGGEPIFVGTERFQKIAQELRATILERVTNPKVWNGQRLGNSFLGQIKKRFQESAEQELLYGGGSPQEKAEQLRHANQKYFGPIFQGKKR